MGRIGVFDAGLGGVLVARDLMKRLPVYDYIYLSDNSVSSYGELSGQDIYSLTEKALNFLFTQGCDIVVIASNTATGQALSQLQIDYMPALQGKSLFGIIAPTCEVAAARTYSGNLGVIASEATVQSNAFVTEIHRIRPSVRVFQQACPLLVPMIETGQQNSETFKALLRTYLSPLVAVPVDTLVLGSPHYSLIKQQISEIMGARVRLVEEGPILGEKFADYLARNPAVEAQLSKQAQRIFYCTSKKAFDLLAGQLYGSQIEGTQVAL